MDEKEWWKNEIDLVTKEIREAKKEKSASKKASLILASYMLHMERIAERILEIHK